MRSTRSTLLVLLLSTLAFGQSNRVSGGGWRKIAPNILVSFQPLGANACTWRFRNADDTRTLVSMRFSYTYSSTLVSRSPLPAQGTQSGDDTLYGSLGPQEESGGSDNYKVPASCATVSIHVTEQKWL